MDQEKLLGLLEREFESTKKRLGFKANLDDIDEIFFIRDYVLQNGFVSPHLSRQISRRIAETYHGWINYLISVMFPNPANMIGMMEGKMFTDVEKKEMNKMISKATGFSALNSYIGISKDTKAESKFIDDSLDYWKSTFGPGMAKIMKKVSDGWFEEKK